MTNYSTQRAMLRFGLRVVEERERRAMTQEQLAEVAELSRRQMQRVEAGEANLNLNKVFELAHALGVEPGALFRPPSATTTRRPGRPARDK